ncbi:hypothetical protein CEXT_10711 [Caerostris extrusa]|uniref:Uncharacterized protein n=1 Tax=Caerostris extrusa TaxID=172846 RepID=A0AAV4VNG8_CAEEX|nr:hypothetical protein CEXT_10711 [Caerostris extrusa]
MSLIVAHHSYSLNPARFVFVPFLILSFERKKKKGTSNVMHANSSAEQHLLYPAPIASITHAPVTVPTENSSKTLFLKEIQA